MSFWETLDNIVRMRTPSIWKDSQYNDSPPFELSNLQLGWLSGLIDENAEPGSYVKFYRGSSKKERVDAILFNIDTEYNAMESILLIGCSKEEIEKIYKYYNDDRWLSKILRREPLE